MAFIGLSRIAGCVQILRPASGMEADFGSAAR